MEYEVIFEMRTSGIGVLWFPLAGVALAGMGVVFFDHFRNQPNVSGPMRTFIGVFRVFFVSFALLWAVLAYFAVGPSQSKLRKSYEGGHYRVVEGRVSNFDPDPRGIGDDRAESFRVGDKVFEYRYYQPSPSFKHIAYHGGPIKEGLQVRVTYIGDAIVKLEVPLGARE